MNVTKKDRDHDSVLDYPDGLKADSGNWLRVEESDFIGLTFPHPEKYKKSSKAKRKDERGDGVYVTDSWDSIEYAASAQQSWHELNRKDKGKKILLGIAKFLAVVFLMYMFVCGLDVLSISLRLLSGKSAGKLFSEQEIIQKPIAGVMIGILFTVLVQSSSVSTSVIISMVAARLIKIGTAIPMIMGMLNYIFFLVLRS